MLLEVVTLTRDVGRDFHAVREAHAGNLTNSRVRLARSLRGDLGADTALERGWVEGRAVLKMVEATTKSKNLRLPCRVLALLLGELIDGCHLKIPP